jgi:hypothetical protein
MHAIVRGGWISAAATSLALLALAASPEDKKAPFDFTKSQEQVVQGQSTKVVAYGEELAIQSLEVTPPEGIAIQEAAEQQPEPKDARQNKAGVRVWSFVVQADKTAKPGERSVVAVTPQGRSYPRTILVVTHVPVISDAVVTATDPSGVVSFRFAVNDAAADVSPKALPFVTAFLDCANYMLFSATQAEKVVMKDAKHGTVYHQAKFGSPGRGLEIHPGYCTLKFSIRDDGGVQSNELEAKAEFK